MALDLYLLIYIVLAIYDFMVGLPFLCINEPSRAQRAPLTWPTAPYTIKKEA